MTRSVIIIFVILILISIFGSGCAVQELVIAEETELLVVTAPVDEAMLLDVGIVEFDAGIPKGNRPEKSGIYGDIRRAEAKYIPYHLKTTLQGTGHWGAVRVIPSTSAFTDVIIKGAIEKSDGEYIELRVSVSDAAGRHWFTRKYETQTGLTSYSKRRDRRRDPYQKVFNDFANDLQQHAASIPARQLQQTRQISELQFFSDMSPAAYNGYLAIDKKGITNVVRLPAENDPSVARMRQIRERDHLVVDTLNEHYANFIIARENRRSSRFRPHLDLCPTGYQLHMQALEPVETGDINEIVKWQKSIRFDAHSMLPGLYLDRAIGRLTDQGTIDGHHGIDYRFRYDHQSTRLLAHS